MVAIAKEAGFMISADDLKKAQSELSDKELESVAGDIAIQSDQRDWFSKNLTC